MAAVSTGTQNLPFLVTLDPADNILEEVDVVSTGYQTNSQLHALEGAYTVLATGTETRATLLEGEAVMLNKGGKRQHLRFPGDAVTMETCCTTPGGAETIRVSVACVDTREALGWTRMRREYRNVPVREFVADMSRWYGFRVEDMACVPEGPRITATVCYRAPVGEVYAQLYAPLPHK